MTSQYNCRHREHRDFRATDQAIRRDPASPRPAAEPAKAPVTGTHGRGQLPGAGSAQGPARNALGAFRGLPGSVEPPTRPLPVLTTAPPPGPDSPDPARQAMKETVR